MSGIIEGYSYDIFISYRQKDNRYDGWVSEFVDNLKKELEATFKEDISLYFDINPHDGLLETHDVDASLKDKLKCLVFIPVISRTYCDPNSFAWTHEFKAFVEQASNDQFGLKVKLPNGNVANRVLPVRIYDLDTADIRLCESALGGVLRGVEFIYSEPGVNRPLKPDDEEKINLNRTKYRNQINKVGNAVKEIISGLKTDPSEHGREINLQAEATDIDKIVPANKKAEGHDGKTKKKILSVAAIIAAILVIAAIFIFPKIFKRDTLENLRAKGKISVAVMPFENMTSNSDLDYLQEAIQDNFINSLTNYPEELIVRQAQSINSLIQNKGFENYASVTPSVAGSISRKLNSDVFIRGSIKQMGSKMRVNAQLIYSKSDEVFRSFEIDGPNREEMIFPIIDSLRKMVTGFLVISKLEKEVSLGSESYASSNSASPEAYKYWIEGNKAFAKFDYPNAVKLYLQSLSRDSNMMAAILTLTFAYRNQGLYAQDNKIYFKEAKKWCLKGYEKSKYMSRQTYLWMKYSYAHLFETPYEAIKACRELLEYDDQQPDLYYQIGDYYNWLGQYDKAISEHEKGLEINNKWGSKPWVSFTYISLGLAYHNTGQYKKERRLYKKAEQVFPDDPLVIYRQAVLELSEGDTIVADRFIKRYRSICKDNSSSEAGITTDLADMYSEAEIPDKAEKYYRQTLILEPENPVYMNNLAYFLIDNDRNITEGMELIGKALELCPDDYRYLDSKGWGLYKQGSYQEALDILQRSWDLRMKIAMYNHPALLHLEAAKKAVAKKKLLSNY